MTCCPGSGWLPATKTSSSLSGAATTCAMRGPSPSLRSTGHQCIRCGGVLWVRVGGRGGWGAGGEPARTVLVCKGWPTHGGGVGVCVGVERKGMSHTVAQCVRACRVQKVTRCTIYTHTHTLCHTTESCCAAQALTSTAAHMICQLLGLCQTMVCSKLCRP